MLVIGAGNIGFQHILGAIDLGFQEIFVLDPYVSDEIRYKLESLGKVRFTDRLSEVSKSITHVIIATSSNVRFDYLNKCVLSFPKLEFLLLEKFLFNDQKHFIDAKVLESSAPHIKFRVNCSKRYIPHLNRYIGAEEIKIEVLGLNWGLLSNAVHFLDLQGYLTNAHHNYKILNCKIDDILPTKRHGYFDCMGKCEIKNQKSRLIMDTTLNSNFIMMKIMADNILMECNLSKSTANILKEDEVLITDIKIPKVRETTKMALTEIIESGSCNLPTLTESIAHHEVVFKLAEDKLQKPA